MTLSIRGFYADKDGKTRPITRRIPIRRKVARRGGKMYAPTPLRPTKRRFSFADMSSTEKKAFDWLQKWSWSDNPVPDPSEELVEYFSMFKPKKKVKLYRGQRTGIGGLGDQQKSKNMKFVSYAHDKEIAESYVKLDRKEGVKARVVERVVDPSEILVDFTMLPFSGWATRGEVIVVRKKGKSVG